VGLDCFEMGDSRHEYISNCITVFSGLQELSFENPGLLDSFLDSQSCQLLRARVLHDSTVVFCAPATTVDDPTAKTEFIHEARTAS